MIDSELLELALEFARRVHEGQVDKSGQPYFGHCERVAARLDGAVDPIVGLLHDVLEDTPTTESEMRELFGDTITDAVVLLTRSADVPDADYYSRIKSDPVALRVKLADISDNLDPARRPVADPDEAARLRRKYESALQALGE